MALKEIVKDVADRFEEERRETADSSGGGMSAYTDERREKLERDLTNILRRWSGGNDDPDEITRSEFDQMSPSDKYVFMSNGGTVVDG